MTEKITFSFGKNWSEFVKQNFNEERVMIAQKHLLTFLELPNLEGKYFLDVGCGSGIHSLAAFKVGAQKIVSFDLDPESVKTTEKLKEIVGNPPHWEVRSGSILDKDFINTLEPADIVYSWGVLHHTGNIWEALANTVGLMKKNGLLYIAIYTTDERSSYWLEVKKKYNRASKIGKKIIEGSYILRHTLFPHLLRLKNPLKTIRQYKKNRGMNFFTDVKDWLGGYPYEHAKIEEVLQFCKKKLNLELVNIKTGEANTEYLFKKMRTP